MKIIEVAREQRDLLNEGIAYIAVWQVAQKNGRHSWFTEDIFPDSGVENDEPVFSDEQKVRLAEIAALDENAVLLNGYIHSWIGSADEPLNAANIALGIEKHYTMHNALVSGYLAGRKKRTRPTFLNFMARAAANSFPTSPNRKTKPSLTRRLTLKPTTIRAFILPIMCAN